LHWIFEPLAVRAGRPQVGYRRQSAGALVKKVIDVDIDQLMTEEDAK
jgi:hypothetical protein